MVEVVNAEPARRALILAGGGLKVAYQAGVMQALDEAKIAASGQPLAFEFADGASGGVFNLAMWCHGRSGQQIADSWRGFRPLRGLSFNWRHWVPVPASVFTYERFLRNVAGPTGDWRLDWKALERCRAGGSRFNLYNFSRQELEVVPAAAMGPDKLISAVSLPVWYPPVWRQGDAYIDAVYATDANLEEVLERGANEIWLIWTVSQAGQWRRGPIAQYFQVIEASANSRLLAALDRIVRSNEAIARGDPDRAEWKRHIEVRCLAAEVPLHYLFDFTRAGMREAVERGVAEGRRWCRGAPGLAAPPPDEIDRSGVYGPEIRLRFTERMSGTYQFGTRDCVLGAQLGDQLGQRLSVRLTADIDNVAWFAAEPRHRAAVTGTVLWDQLAGGKADIHDGHVSLFVYRRDPRRKQMVYVLPFRGPNDNMFTLVGVKYVTNDPGGARRHGPLRIWTDTTTLYTRIVNGTVTLDPVSGEPVDDANPVVCAGILRLTTPAFLLELLTFRPGPGIGGGLGALAGFGQFFLRQLWQVYGHTATHAEDRPTPIETVLGQAGEQPAPLFAGQARMSRQASRGKQRQPSEFPDWPAGNAPSDAWVYAHNELAVPVSPDRIWEWLSRARQWPHWYPNSWRVEILARTGRVSRRERLRSQTEFNWITFGLPITAKVDPCDRPDTIGWTWRSRGWAGAASGYHIWSIEAQPYGSRVVTEETQIGLLPRLLRPGLQRSLHLSHQLWLRRLSKNAIDGVPR